VFVGLVEKPEDNRRAGITYYHKWRVIIPATALGCKDVNIGRVCGFVNLDTGWQLSKNKDDISDNKEELADAVYEACKELFAKASAEDSVVKSAAFASQITDAIRGVFATPDSKAKRERGEKKGTVDPVDGPRKHKRARKLQPGEKIAQEIRAGKIRVDFRSAPDGDDSIGKVDAAGDRVIIHTTHPAIAEIQRRFDHRAALVIAVSLIVNHATTSGPSGQTLLPVIADAAMESQFIVGISEVLRRANTASFQIPMRA
jgi:hypothetical protein